MQRRSQCSDQNRPPHGQGPVQAAGNGECGSSPGADVMRCALCQLWATCWAPPAAAPGSHLLGWGKAALVLCLPRSPEPQPQRAIAPAANPLQPSPSRPGSPVSAPVPSIPGSSLRAGPCPSGLGTRWPARVLTRRGRGGGPFSDHHPICHASEPLGSGTVVPPPESQEPCGDPACNTKRRNNYMRD